MTDHATDHPTDDPTDQTTDSVISADNTLRRRVLFWSGLVFVAGLVLLAVVARVLHVPDDPTKQDLQSAASRAIWLARVFAWLVGVSFVAIGAWFLRLGRSIRRSGQFPPPGMRVIRDTPVRAGAHARALAHLATATGIASALLGSVAAWILWQLATAVLGR
jgi:hypothetical protein